MSQSTDYTISDQPGASFLTEINSILAAIQSLNSGATAPSNPASYMLWADTTTGYLKIRNGANDAWITGPQLSDMKAPDAAKLGGALPAAYQLVADMTTAATAGKGILRDGSGRAKIANAAASDDIMAFGQYTAADVFAKVLTQDGPTSGLAAQTAATATSATTATSADQVLGIRGYKTYAGYVASDGSAVLPAGWSINKTGTGVYAITHNLNFTGGIINYSLQVTPAATLSELAYTGTSADVFTVSTCTINTITPADKAFSFVLFDLR